MWWLLVEQLCPAVDGGIIILSLLGIVDWPPSGLVNTFIAPWRTYYGNYDFGNISLS